MRKLTLVAVLVGAALSSIGQVMNVSKTNYCFVAADSGNYWFMASCEVPNVQGWGTVGITNFPADLTNAVAVSCGASHAVALRYDGIVEAWGDDVQTESDVPVLIGTNAVSVAAGQLYSVAALYDGTVVEWGSMSGVKGVNQLTLSKSAVQVGAGDTNNFFVLFSDGSVEVVSNFVEQAPVLLNCTHIASTSAGKSLLKVIGLHSDGTVAVWGASATNNPSNVTNAVSVGISSTTGYAVTSNNLLEGWPLSGKPNTNYVYYAGASQVSAYTGNVAYLTTNGNIVAISGTIPAEPPVFTFSSVGAFSWGGGAIVQIINQ